MLNNNIFKLGTLFSGIGAPEFALDNLNVKYISNFACEIDDFARLSFKANHFIDDEVFYKDIYSINTNELRKDTDLLVAGFPCFTAGHKILTMNGYKNIEDIIVGDYVLTHKNRFKKVLTTMIKEIQNLNHLKIYGSVLHKVTNEHPYYVAEKIKKWNKKDKTYDITYSDFKWVETKDLIPNKHYALININKDNQILNDFIPLDVDEFYWFIGRFLADGWYEDGVRKGRKNSLVNKVFLCSSHLEKDFIVEKLNKLNLHYGIYKERTVYKYIFSNKSLVDFFKKFGRYSYGKYFPNEILSLNKDKLKLILEGYESGDGYFDKKNNCINITTINEKLALGLQNIVHKVYNNPCLIRFCKTKDTTIIENRVVNQKNFYIVTYKKNEIPLKGKQTALLNDYMLFPIKKNEKIDLENKVKVYNLEVEDDNSYTVNNIIVHNCQAFSSSGRQLGTNCPTGRGILYLEMMRIIEANLPKVILLENVKGITFEKHTELREDLYNRLNKLGYCFKETILNTYKVTGIPQSRNRWFLVGFLNKNQYDNFEFPLENAELLNIKDFLEMNKENLPNHCLDAPFRFLQNFYANLSDKTDGSISAFTVAREYKGFRIIAPTMMASEMKAPKCVKMDSFENILKIFNESNFDYIGYKDYIEKNICNNIRQLKNKDFDLNIAIKYGFNYDKLKYLYRKILPRESLNLQGFPKDFVQVVSNAQLIKQSGNSMTVNVMEKIIEKILKTYIN